MDNKNSFLISVLVDNRFGVLTRIAGLFARRGFNIDSLTVSATQDPKVSRMTIAVNGDSYVEDQILKQLRKQVYVFFAEKIEGKNVILRELVLVKVRADQNDRRELLRICKQYSAEVADVTEDVMVLQLTDESEIVDRFLEELNEFGIIELCRTGLTAMESGDSNILDHTNL